MTKTIRVRVAHVQHLVAYVEVSDIITTSDVMQWYYDNGVGSEFSPDPSREEQWLWDDHPEIVEDVDPSISFVEETE